MSFSFYPSGLKVVFGNKWSDPLVLYKARPVAGSYTFDENHTLITELNDHLIGTDINVTGRAISNASKLSCDPIDISAQTVSAAHLACYLDNELVFLATLDDGAAIDLSQFSFVTINPFLAFAQGQT